MAQKKNTSQAKKVVKDAKDKNQSTAPKKTSAAKTTATKTAAGNQGIPPRVLGALIALGLFGIFMIIHQGNICYPFSIQEIVYDRF